MKKILTTLLFLALCATGFSQSSALNVSSTLAGNAGYQPLIARGVTNGYAPLDSNALVPGTNLFPGFVSATNGSFWVKSGSGLAVVQGLTFTSNTISMSHVNVGLIENDALTLYGISLDSGFNQPIVIRGGQSTIYFATAQTVGAANTGYTGFSWSISGPGNFYLGSGTITGNLSLPSASTPNGLSVNFGSSVFSSTADFVFTNANVTVPNVTTNGLFNSNSIVVATTKTYALNTASADNLYPRVNGTNTWPSVQTFSGGIVLGSALPIIYGGTGGTNQATAQSSLGLSIGTNVEAYSSSLNQIGTLGVPTSNSVLVGGSTNWVLQTASQFVGSLGLSIGTNVQAFSSNLTSVSAVVPTNNYVLIGGVSTNWTNASPASLVTTLGLSIGTNVQAFSSNLQSISSIGTPSANQFLASISSSWTAVSGSTARAAMGVSIGTNVQAYSTYLSQISSLTPSNNYVLIGNGSSSWTNISTNGLVSALGLSIGTNVQAYSPQLSQISTIIPSNNYVLVGNYSNNWVSAPPSSLNTLLGLSIGTNVQAYSAQLDQIASLTPANNYMLVGNSFNVWSNVPTSYLLTSLGLTVGKNVQAYSPYLTMIATNGAPVANEFLGSISTNWVAMSASQARSNMGVVIGTNVQAYSSNLQAIASGTPVPLSLGGTGGTNASNSLVNLGIGNGITTNITLISISTTNTAAFVTNTIGISNGIITNWTRVGL